MDTRETRQQRTRRVLIAFAAIVVGAIAAFTVTMSMTTSYPSTPEPPSVARPPVPHVAPVAGVPERAAATTPSPVDAPIDNAGATSATSATSATVPASVVDGAQRGARGGVLVDDGTAPRSRGNLGTLAKEDVKAGVAAVKDKVKDCYERGLEVDEHLGGTLKVSFTLEGNDEGKGVVTKGEIADSDMHSPFFEACVLKEIASAEFKAPGGGGVVNVTYPFRFANDPDDAGP